MLVRIRCRDGNFRYQLNESDDFQELVQKILGDAQTSDPNSLKLSNQPRGNEQSVIGLHGSLKECGISHGDLLFASYTPLEAIETQPPQPDLPGSSKPNGVHPEAGPSKTTTATIADRPKKPWEDVVEDGVDKYWQKTDGKIPRKRDPRMCRHGDKSMCEHCAPLEPYDANYRQEHAIKHMSFNSYLRSIQPPSQNSSFNPNSPTYIPPLTPPFYRVAVPCPSGSHAPYPAAICTKCQPSAITLQAQRYRMVDHVEFADPKLIEEMLGFWRQSGIQRFGFLVGRYEPYDLVPMGVKAVVDAIWEPPQADDPDGITLGWPWEEEGRITELANMAGGQSIVGCVFTDLELDATPREDGTIPPIPERPVLYKRGPESYFLSCQETVFSSKLQLSHPTYSKYSSTGKFSSRFVTCVLSGTKEGGIELTAYQVSDQAMGLVDADLIEPSVDPGIVRVREPAPDEVRYVPDVFYRYRNQYNLEVKESARPCFPVEYLIVTLTHGFPTSPNPRFTSPSPFPIENRMILDENQSIDILVKQLNESITKEGEVGLAKWLSDWHLLGFLDTSGMLSKTDMRAIANVAAALDEKEKVARLRQLNGLPGWETLMTIARESARPNSPAHGRSTSGLPGPSSGAAIDPIEIPDDVDMPPENLGGGDGFTAANDEEVAMVMSVGNVSKEQAAQMLDAAGGNVQLAIELVLGS